MDGKRLQELFKNASYHGEMKLSADIWRTISLKEEKRKKISYFKYIGVLVLSLSGFVFVVRDVLTGLSQSGFYEYMSLARESGAFTAYWKEFILSIAESLPLTSITVSLLLLFVLAFSMRRLVLRNRNQLSIA